jgi:SPP1 gp7 family putative phage head morphogenesis protein
LEAVARHTGELIDGYPPLEFDLMPSLLDLLGSYAKALRPWAQNTAHRMLMDVNQADIKAWHSLGQELSTQLRFDIDNANVGVSMRALLNSQVELITSLPIEAGERVQRLTLEALTDSRRANELRDMILASGDVTASRAQLIAITETSRTASALTETRSLAAGAPTYIWRTSQDATVRPDHQELDGKVFAWADPPIADKRTGARAHPGCIYRCRCYAEPII